MRAYINIDEVYIENNTFNGYSDFTAYNNLDFKTHVISNKRI